MFSDGLYVNTAAPSDSLVMATLYRPKSRVISFWSLMFIDVNTVAPPGDAYTLPKKQGVKFLVSQMFINGFCINPVAPK